MAFLRFTSCIICIGILYGCNTSVQVDELAEARKKLVAKEWIRTMSINRVFLPRLSDTTKFSMELDGSITIVRYSSDGTGLIYSYPKPSRPSGSDSAKIEWSVSHESFAPGKIVLVKKQTSYMQTISNYYVILKLTNDSLIVGVPPFVNDLQYYDIAK
jgi:hypothetical protein